MGSFLSPSGGRKQWAVARVQAGRIVLCGNWSKRCRN